MRILVFALVALLLAGCATQAPTLTVDPASTFVALGEYDPVGDLAARVRAAVEAEAPVNLSAMMEADLLGNGRLAAPREWPVVLKPGELFALQPWAEIDGARVPFPNVSVYEGHVAGEPGWPVRLTVAEAHGWARGTIRINDTLHLVRIGLDGNLPYHESVAQSLRAPPAARFEDATIDAPLSYDKDGQEPVDCLRPVPPHVEPVVEPLSGPTALPPIHAQIVLDADRQFLDALGAHAFPMMVAFLHEVDAIYAHEVGIRFQLVGLHGNTNESYYPDPEKEAPLGRLAEHWNARPDVERDVVHLFTGQPSSYAMANCIGGAGDPEIAYTFTPLNWARSMIVFHEQAFAHELGHIFSAHHHYGNHVEATWGSGRVNPAGAAPLVTQPQGGLATIMIQGYTPGAKPVFGTLEKSVIRGWAEANMVG